MELVGAGSAEAEDDDGSELGGPEDDSASSEVAAVAPESPAGVSSVAVCPKQTHVSQSVVAWPGQATGSNCTIGLSPKTSLWAMMSKW